MKCHFITAPKGPSRLRGKKISFCSFSFSGASACESLKLDECIDPQRPVDDWQPDMTVIFSTCQLTFSHFQNGEGSRAHQQPKCLRQEMFNSGRDAGHLQAQTVGTGVDPGIAAGTQVG